MSIVQPSAALAACAARRRQWPADEQGTERPIRQDLDLTMALLNGNDSRRAWLRQSPEDSRSSSRRPRPAATRPHTSNIRTEPEARISLATARPSAHSTRDRRSRSSAQSQTANYADRPELRRPFGGRHFVRRAETVMAGTTTAVGVPGSAPHAELYECSVGLVGRESSHSRRNPSGARDRQPAARSTDPRGAS